MQERLIKHKTYIACKQLTKATGAYSTLPVYSVSEMKVSIIEKVNSLDSLVRKEREESYIRVIQHKI